MSKLFSQTLSLNQTHYVEGTESTFTYKLPQSREFSPEDTVGFQEISFYNSFFNIESSRNNNQFKIIWNADTTTEYTITIDDSYLTIADLNELIKAKCLEHKLYLVEDATGKMINYITLGVIASQYKVEFKFYPLETSAQSTALGYSKPAGATWDFPTTPKTPQFEFLSNDFNNLLGFPKNTTYPTTVQSAQTQVVSPNIPQILTVTNVQLSCNLINNPYTIPQSILSSIPVNGDFGNLLYFQNASGNYSNIKGARYDQITVSFLDQLGKPLVFRDRNINILLNIKSKLP